MIRKKILPFIICIAVAGSQTSILAEDLGDTQMFSESAENDREEELTGESISEAAPDDQTDESTDVSDISAEQEDIQELTENADDETEEELSPENINADTAETEEAEDISDSGAEIFGDGSVEAEEEIEYIKGRPLTEEEEAEQLAPFEKLTSYSTAVEIGNDTDDIPMGRAAAYSSYYNAADQGYVTSVKNQEPYGMCWAFGMASLLETSLLSQGLGAYDLSEEHLAYFFANRRNDPLGNTAGDVNHHYGTDDNGKIDYHEGGNDLLAAMFLSTWSGMTTEKDVPLATDTTHTQKTGAVPSGSKAYNAAAYLKNAYFSDYSVNAMKKLLMANHSVTVMYNAQNTYYNASTGAYSYPISTKSVNHVVTVVGWDDNYSAANFRASSKVTSNGAWIVKNSWGKNWGNSGYFYMSYEDKSVCELVAATATNKPEYANNYFYDGTSGLASISMYPGEKLASVFKAKAGNGKAEKLGEITFASTTKEGNSTFNVQIYTDLKDAGNPTSGTPAYAKPFSCRQTMAGIETFKIPEVLIRQNSMYSVVITNAGNNTVKYYVEASTNYGWCSFEPSISAGQSFICSDSQNEWSDMKDFSPSMTPRIKAHTKTLNSSADMKLSETALNLYVGDKKLLKASATRAEMTASGISWNSSDTNVVKVSANGEITAIHPGTTTVSCYGNKAKGIKAYCKITVKLRKTSGVKIAEKSYNKIKISWSAVSGCNRYEIYRCENGGKEKKMAVVNSGICTWTDTKVKTGGTYIYRVRAYYVCTGRTTVYGACSDKISVKAELGRVKAKAKAKIGPCNSVSWNSISGADGYRIYRKVKGQNWKRIKDVKKNILSYEDSGIQGITSYAYAVRGYRLVDGKKVLGSYTASAYITSYPMQQKISKICKTAKGLKIYWKTQKNADCYQIYRRTKNSSWTKIKTVSSGKVSSFEDKTAKKGTTYYYAVRAGIKISTGKVLCGDYASKKQNDKHNKLPVSFLK